jgi:Putative Ig domain
MQRFILLGAVSAVMMSLAACGGDGSPSSSDSAATSSAASAGTTASASTAQTEQLSVSGSPAKTAAVGNWYAFQPQVAGAGAKATFSVANAPRWSTFNPATGELSGTPDAEDAGTYANITIQVSNGSSTVSMTAFSITVSQANANAVALTWTPPAANADGTPLTNLAGYRIMYGTEQSAMTQSVEVSNPKAHSFELANLPAGHWYVSMVAYSSEGTTSTQSAPIEVSI